jgi:hypothetical protein
MFAVLNIVTGVFVDSAMRANSDNRQLVVHEELDAKNKMLKNLRRLFEEMDENGDGTISMDEFCARLNDERVVAYFQALKLDIHDTKAVFHLLDMDASQEVDVSEFLDGCYQLQGEAKSVDTKVMRLQLHWVVQHLEALHESQKAQIDMLSQLLTSGSGHQRLKGKGTRQGHPRHAGFNGHARRSLDSSEIVPGTTSDGQFMHLVCGSQRSCITAARPMQHTGLCGAHGFRERDMLVPEEEADGSLHHFLAGA